MILNLFNQVDLLKRARRAGDNRSIFATLRAAVSEDSLLERVTAAAEERQLSHNSLITYRRTWLKIIAWAAAEGLVLETFPAERVSGEFYEEATRGRSASHHLQVKAALALLIELRAHGKEKAATSAEAFMYQSLVRQESAFPVSQPVVLGFVFYRRVWYPAPRGRYDDRVQKPDCGEA